MPDWKRASKRTKAATLDFYGIPHSIKPSAPRAKPRDLEGPVVAAVSDLLSVHPKVLFAVRQNSGAASYESKSGTYAPLWFYRIVRKPQRPDNLGITVPDFWGILTDGRFMAMEAKRPDWKTPCDERERKQAHFLQMVRDKGGLSGFVRSADEAASLLA